LQKTDVLIGSGVTGKLISKGVMIMTLKEYKEKRMQDPAFVQAYDEMQPEMNVIRAMIDARTSQNMTQKELSERTGIAQTEISKLENGTRNPSIKLLQRLADGMDMVLNVTFTPKQVAGDSPKRR
jgi:DNA-binding XRE family transcriptional regulator